MTITRSQVADRLRIEGHFFTKAAKEVDALVSEVERLREALKDIAHQKTQAELERDLEPDQFDGADFEGAYDAMIEVARAALTQEQ
jgi:hypothetical protein